MHSSHTVKSSHELLLLACILTSYAPNHCDGSHEDQPPAEVPY